MIYVYIASFVGFFASVISMAEIASMYVVFQGVDICCAFQLTRPVLQPRADNITG